MSRVAVVRRLDVAHQRQHLPQSPDVQRQQGNMQHQNGVGGVQVTIGDEQEIAGDGDDAQRHHCLGVKGRKDQCSGKIAEPFRKPQLGEVAEDTRKIHDNPPNRRIT
jgi:hypothetical protein